MLEQGTHSHRVYQAANIDGGIDGCKKDRRRGLEVAAQEVGGAQQDEANQDILCRDASPLKSKAPAEQPPKTVLAGLLSSITDAQSNPRITTGSLFCMY